MASAEGDSSGEECGLQIDIGKPDGRQTKTRGKGAKATKTPVEISAWKPGDIVWAKVSGFNYWPAKVFDPSDSSSVPRWLSEPPKPNYILVRFFGSYDMQWVSHRLIEGYENGFKKKLQTKSRSKLFQKSVKEVKEYVEDGVSPEGLTQPVQDPDAHSSSEGEKEEGEEDNDEVVASSENDQASPTKKTKRKVTKVKDPEPASNDTQEQHESSGGGSSGGVVTQSSNSNGNRSRRRKGSPRKLSSSSADNLEEVSQSKKVKVDFVEEKGKAVCHGGAGGKGEEIKAFTSAPLPLTANSEKSGDSAAAKSAETTKTAS